MSGGEAQRVEIADLIVAPTIPVLDEPTTGLHVSHVDVPFGYRRSVSHEARGQVITRTRTFAVRDSDVIVSVYLLGTGTPLLDAARCGSGTAISAMDGWILIDCGRGVTQRIAEAGLELDRLLGVYLTHHHSDHVSDLSTLAIARWSNGATRPLSVVVPEGPGARFARDCLSPFDDQAFYSQAPTEAGPRPTVVVQPFVPTNEPTSISEAGPFHVSSVLVDHHPIEAAVGYRVDIGSASVVVSGDTTACRSIESIAAGVDLLIHEALLARSVRPQLLEWNASAESVGSLAHRAGVKRLVLTHLLPPPSGESDEVMFVNDARSGGYNGPIDVARDLLRVDLAGPVPVDES